MTAVSKDRQARMALWLARLYGLEAIEHEYAWPPTEESAAEAAALEDAADGMHALARRLLGAEPDWRAAVESFESAEVL